MNDFPSDERGSAFANPAARSVLHAAIGICWLLTADLATRVLNQTSPDSGWLIRSYTPFPYADWSRPCIILLLIAGALLFALLPRAPRIAAWGGLAYAAAVGMLDRAARLPMITSDVTRATDEALRVLRSGGDPYLHTFLSTTPPGSPFPYLPGELLFYGVPYALLHTVAHADQAAAIFIPLLFVALAPIVSPARAALGAALYAMFQTASLSSVNGSNETALTLIALASIVTLAWSEHWEARDHRRAAVVCALLSAVLLAWALTFKLLVWPLWPFLARYLCRRRPAQGRRHLAATAIAATLIVAPLLIPAPGAMILNVARALWFHSGVWGSNIWFALAGIGRWPPPPPLLSPWVWPLATLTLFAWLIAKPSRSLGEAVLRSFGLIVGALVLAHSTSCDYFTLPGTLLAAAITLSPPPNLAPSNNRQIA